ncbi:MAG: AtpZ/AtpI family protein [Chloroflexi bacterium]|nr:AtpZ/AtpI family protein [Chloroflexota bacterium]
MDRWRGALRLLGVGWYVAFSLIAPMMGGIWLDGRFGTSVLFTLLGLGLGVALVFVGVYRMLLPEIKDGSGRDGKRH